MQTTQTSSGFTLVELLVVIAILGMLMGLLLPALGSARESGRLTVCQNNMRQYGIALQTYHQNNRSFPIGNHSGNYWTFQSRLLPFLGHDALADVIDYNSNCFLYSAKQPPELDSGNRAMPIDMCPNDHNAGKIFPNDPLHAGFHACTNYLGVTGTSGQNRDGIMLFGTEAISLEQVTDGDTTTLIMGERGIPNDLFWGWTYCAAGDGTGNGDNILTTQYGLSPGVPDTHHYFHFWSYHVQSANFLMAGGSVHKLGYDIDLSLFQALSTRAGHEAVVLP